MHGAEEHYASSPELLRVMAADSVPLELQVPVLLGLRVIERVWD